MSTRGAVIGTAGHIDHGKTSLVHALTGIDTDRLKEEKARGITIELGFAHLALPSGRVVGVVDVPGHERFVRAMVAGAVGIDLMVLVVAADESVMPQTREHVDVCRLLGVERAVVALTKIDAAGPDERAVAEAEVRELLAGTPYAEATIVGCSARTGVGLDALRAAIDASLPNESTRVATSLARLPIDRVFTMHGFGTVVTGTLWSGVLRVGDEVELVPSDGVRERIRGLQVHGHGVELAEPGHRVAVNVPLPRERVERGLVLGHAGALEAGRVFDAEVTLLAGARRPLARRSRLLLHAGTTQVEASVRLIEGERLSPGARAFVEIESNEPLVLFPGDRFVLRGYEVQRGHGTTIGGGIVLRVLGARSRRGARTTPAILAAHATTRDAETRVLLELERAGEHGLDRIALRRRVADSEAQLESATERLLARRATVRFDRARQADIAATAFEALRTRALDAAAAHHRAHPIEAGIVREALRATVTDDPRLLHRVVESLIESRGLVAEGDRVRRADHDAAGAARSSGVEELAARVAKILADSALAPPRPVDLPPLLESVAQAQLNGALDALVRAGRAVRIQGLCFDAQAVTKLRDKLVAHLAAHGQINAAEWKEMSAVSRKYSIPLAEHFDAEKVTIRVGEVRKKRG